MRPLIPPPLSAGDIVAVVAPAGVVNPSDLQFGIDWLAERYTIHCENEIVSAYGYLAGSDKRRIAELQAALSHPKTGAVMAARGGFGTSRIIDALDVEALHRTPKWIVGSSDLTALLIHLWDAFRLVSIHGPMTATIHRTTATDLATLIDLLEKSDSYTTPLRPITAGTAEGPLVGGNLTMLAHMVGTVDPACYDGAILFLEDVGEKPYRIDRYLTQLYRAGVLDRVGGIVLGEFTGCDVPGIDGALQDTIDTTLKRLQVPLAADYPAAHGSRNAPFRHGGKAVLTVSSDSASLHSYI